MHPTSPRVTGCDPAPSEPVASGGRAGAPPPAQDVDLASRFPHSYAVVDVEATGLKPRHDRVLSIGVVLLGPDGSVEHSWSTLLDPGCDPGPVHIHGLTRAALAGSPTFDQILDRLAELLAGRVLVAHNARYDWAMLAAEAQRAGRPLAVEHRLCTWVLSQRLDLPVPDLKLSTLAAHWGVPQTRAHDAADDAAVLARLLPRLLRVAAEREIELPLTACDGEIPPSVPDRNPKPVTRRGRMLSAWRSLTCRPLGSAATRRRCLERRIRGHRPSP